MKKQENSLFGEVLTKLLDNVPINGSEGRIFDLGINEFESAGLAKFVGAPNLCLPLTNTPRVRSAIESAGLIGQSPYLDIPSIQNKLVLVNAGARFLIGLNVGMSIPNPSNITAEWLGETATGTDGAGVMGSVKMSPLRIFANQTVSVVLLKQGGDAALSLIINMLIDAIAEKLQSTILSAAARTATSPQGIAYAVTSGALTSKVTALPDYDALQLLEAEVDGVKSLEGKFAYIVNHRGKRTLRSIRVDEGNPKRLFEDNKINEYPAFVTNSCASDAGSGTQGDALFFGNWDNLVITQFGGYILTVDPYSLAKNAEVIVSLSGFFDAKSHRGSSLTSNDLSTDVNEYVGFACMPMAR